MPRDKNGYGSSDHTPEKQETFQGICSMLAGICAGQRWCPSYVYIDMNAGPGIVPDLGIDGSPLIFLKTAQDRNLPYVAHLIEENSSSVAALRARCDVHKSVTIYHGNHELLVPTIVDALLQRRTPLPGLIYHDPNGEPSFPTLATVSRLPQAQRLDILIHLPAAGLKRINGWRARRARPYQTLLDSIRLIDKQRWIVQEPSGNWQWTNILGSNWVDFPAWRKRGFFPLDSEKGQEIIGRLAYPEDERPGFFGQLDLPLL